MIPDDVMRAIRQRDRESVAYRGKLPTCAQMDRRDLLAALDEVTRERDKLARDLAATQIGHV